MPRKTVVQCNCDRCGRTWYEDALDKEGEPELLAAVAVTFVHHDKSAPHNPICIKFEMLCESCEKTVKNLVAQIGKDLKHTSPKRGAKKKGQQDADPSPPTPADPPKTPARAVSNSGTSAAHPTPARSGMAPRG